MSSFPERVLGFRFDGRRITVPEFLEATSRVLSILREVDARTTSREGGTLDWVIKDLQYGSAAVEVEAEPRGETTPVWAPAEVVQRFKSGMKRVIEAGERPEYFSETAMRRAFELASLLNENGIQAFRVRSNGEEVAITPGLRKTVRDAMEGRYRALGSIEGRIDALSAHEEPYFCTVYTLLTGEPVRCYLGAELLDDAYRYFRQRVIVRGIFNTRPDGEITSMRVREIERLPDAGEVPSVDEMIGIFADDD